MNGLHVCKAANAPQVGQIKTFTISGDRIKSTPADKGGQPYKILKAVQSETYKDQYGNLGFNLVIEPAGGQEGTAPRPQSPPARQNGGGWSDDRSNRIERQHSQEMAIRYFALRPRDEAINTQALRELIDWFQRDIGHEPRVPGADPEPPSQLGEQPF